MAGRFAHAGMGWPANASGEHPDRETIYALPGVSQGALLMLADSGRYWYTEARQRCPLVVWRALPRPANQPALLSNWNPDRVTTEVTNLWLEAQHGGVEWFTPLNELQFEKENGAPFPGYGQMAYNLGALRDRLRSYFRGHGHDVRMLFPAWVPSDDGDHAADWVPEALKWDGLVLHAYGDRDSILGRYAAYRALVGPTFPIFIGEWNDNHTGADDRATLEGLSDLAVNDPAFLGAAYYVWETNNSGEHDLSVWGNADRLALFQKPPGGHLSESGEVAGDDTSGQQPAPQSEADQGGPSVDPWQFWTTEQLAAAIGCPLENAQAYWPKIVSQLALCGIADQPIQLAAAGTIAAEDQEFVPIREAYYLGEPEPAESYRRTLAYYPWYGRGFIQLTNQGNYAAFGTAVDDLWQAGGAIDLIARPDDALDPDVAAAVLAVYFRDHAGGALVAAARAGDWTEVRRLVNGGTGRLEVQNATIAALGGMPPIDAPAAPVVGFNGDPPPDSVILQQNDWTCAVRSLYWAIWSTGTSVSYGTGQPNDVYDWMVPAYDGVNVGLLDHTGVGIVKLLQSKGWDAGSDYPVTIGQVRERAGKQPVLIGGDTWNHWVGVRGLEDDGTLVLANPSPGWMGIGSELRDSFGRLGPFAMVWIDMAPAPDQPEPPNEEDPAVIAELQQQVASLTVERDALQQKVSDLVTGVAVMADDDGDKLAAAIAEIRDGASKAEAALDDQRAIRAARVGARPNG